MLIWSLLRKMKKQRRSWLKSRILQRRQRLRLMHRLTRPVDLFSRQKSCWQVLTSSPNAGLGDNSLDVLISWLNPWGVVGMLSTLFQGVAGGLLDPIPVISLGEGRVHPGWWQRPPHKVPTAHQEQFWGSVSCSTCSSVLSRGTSNLPITSHLLYLLSYGRPAMFMWQYYLDEYWKYRDKKIIRNVSVNDITCNTALKTLVSW